METRRKINWILILQAWAILWVVIGHSFMTIPFDNSTPWYVVVTFNFAYSFHMPLFIFVSGYLFYMTRIEKPMPYLKMLLEKLQRLGIPFVFLTIVTMALKTIFSSEVARSSSFSIMEFVNAIIYPNDGPMREFWFLAVIMWMFLLKPLFAFLLKRNWTLWGGVVALIIMKYAIPNVEPDLFCITRSCRYAIFFYLGVLFSKFRLDSLIISKIKFEWLLLLLSALYTASFFFVDKSISQLTTPICGIALSIVIALTLDKYLPKIFISFRDYTYQIYLLGIIFQMGVKILYNKGLLSYGGGYVLCIILGLFAPVLTSWVIQKINWKPLYIILGLK